MSFGQPPHGPPPHGGFGPPPQGYGVPPQGYGGPPQHGFGPPVAATPPAVQINTDLALIVGLVVAMFCGCLPGGLFAVYFADQAKKAARRGDAVEANAKLRLSYIVSGVSVGILCLLPCLYFAFVFLVAGAGAIAG
ncbi:MAG: hypothetical protein KF729_23615 [Sandaracinaceae bacterium]|nr:hypothetical protein [Sandaracinaceae bacterium]